MPVLLSDLLAYAKIAPELQKEFPTDTLPPHKCFFCPMCKPNSKDRPDFIP